MKQYNLNSVVNAEEILESSDTLKEINEYTITSKGVNIISNALQLKDISIEQLRAIRNGVVIIYSIKESVAKKCNNNKLFEMYALLISSITAVIDDKIYKLGGEV